MTTPTSAAHLFDIILPETLKRLPSEGASFNCTYVFRIGDGPGDGHSGAWTLSLTSPHPFCVRGEDISHPDCTIEVKHEDFMAMVQNPSLGMQLYFQGKLKVTGDPMLATKLQKLFAL